MSRTLNLVQTSPRRFSQITLLALFISLLVFPLWQQVFTRQKLAVQATLTSNTPVWIRVYWDDPVWDANAYEHILVNADSDREYLFYVADTPWSKLKFVAETEASLEIRLVNVRDQRLISTETGQYSLPFRWNNRGLLAGIATCLTWGWLSILGFSTVHLWHGETWKRLSSTSFVITLAVTLALFWTLVFYPGIITSDSEAQWKVALYLWGILPDIGGYATNWHPPMMSWIMGATYVASRTFGFFIFLQLLLFYSSLLFLLRRCCSHRIFLIGTLFMIVNPAIWGIAPVIFKDIWFATGLNLISLSFLLTHNQLLKQWQILSISILFLIGGILTFAFRHNSIIILPLILIFLWKMIAPIRLKAFLILALCVSLSIAKIPPESYRLQSINLYPISFMWEQVGILRQLSDPNEITKYGLGSVGNTDLAIKNFDCQGPDRLLWNEKVLNLEKLVKSGSEIKRKWLNLIKAHPKEFLLNRVCMYYYALGLGNQVHGRVINPQYVPYEEVATSSNRLMYDPKIKHVENHLFEVIASTFQPFPLYTAWNNLLLLGVIGTILYSLKRLTFCFFLLSGLAILYFSGFFLVPVGMTFRYFLPSAILIWVACFHAADRLNSILPSISFIAKKSYPKKLE
ncbi:MAG: hypothetical protein SFW36_16910 [Leptolyngbyaceae cyanobacterium bins.59]|nr:hypothetical protein [Leptolyngbyaceae cyanobacterium bins.59]